MIRTVDAAVARVRASYRYTPASLTTSGLWAAQGVASTNVYLMPGFTYTGFEHVQQARTRVEIDLNVRVRGNDTFVGFEDVYGPLAVGEIVEVFESESGVSGEGKVTEIDSDRELVYLSVDWPSLKEDDSSSPSERASSPASIGLLFIEKAGSAASTYPLESWIEMVARPSLVEVGKGDGTIWITAPSFEPSGSLSYTCGATYIDMRQNVLLRNSVVVAA